MHNTSDAKKRELYKQDKQSLQHLKTRKLGQHQ